MQLLNVPLLKNPLNWLTVFLMLLLLAIGGHLLLTLFGVEPSTANTEA